ncbi:MAG TPA: type II secretion system F family protein [Caldisericia bacterium]|nr:type II secretion system F family protein [Caldisericia bacterium]HQL66234.1 type II secretion system F family protein [Caldisericia bacterium]
MAKFKYKGRDSYGKVVEGRLEATSVEEIEATLKKRGLIPLKIEKSEEGGLEGLLFKFFGKRGTNIKSLLFFTRQFTTMLKAGLPLTRILDILSYQSPTKKLREVSKEIKKNVESGIPLSTSMLNYPNIFSNLYVSMVRAGEVGGSLDKSLERITEFLENDYRLRQKIKSAMSYPIFVLIFAFSLGFFMLTIFVPQFAGFFADLDVPLPGLTQFTLNLSNGLRKYWWLILTVILAVYALYNLYKSTPQGRERLDKSKLKMPILGNVNHLTAMSRFSGTLSSLLASGVPLLQALDTVSSTIDNVIIEKEIMKIEDRVRRGETLSKPMEESNLFTPMVVQMTAVGEETGELEEMLHKVSSFYEEEVDRAVGQLTSLIEPLLIIFVGGIIGFIVISLYLPIFYMVGQIQ